MIAHSADYETAIAANTLISRITGTLRLQDGSVYPITEAMIKENSLYINEQCIPGEDLVVGSANVAEMGLSLIFPEETIGGIGSLFKGGKIAYILREGDPGYNAYVKKGFIIPADLTDLDESFWFEGDPYICSQITPFFDIGKGVSNTDRVASYDDVDPQRAAVIAKAFSVGDYDDWFLPSADELEAIMLNRVALEIPDADYWSSTDGVNGESGGAYATCYDYSADAITNDLKSSVKKILPVRTFAEHRLDHAELDLSHGIVVETLIFPAWNAYALYTAGAYVSYLGINYVAIGDPDQGFSPPNPTYWAVVTEEHIWEDVPLGIFTIVSAKRNGVYVDIIANDTFIEYDVQRTVGTTLYEVSDRQSYIPFTYHPLNCTVHLISGSEYLTFTENATAYAGDYKFTDWNILLITNTTNSLSVTLTDATKTITIALANADPSKNTLALIQAALAALYNAGGNDMQQHITWLTVTKSSNWDSTAKTSGEIDVVFFKDGIFTQQSVLDTYPNYNKTYTYGSTLYTDRDMMMYLSQINSAFVRKSRYGRLEVLPLHKAAVDRIITANARYKTKVEDSTVQVTAVQMSVNGTLYSVGSTGLTLELAENPLVSNFTSAQITTMLTNILNDITQTVYHPFETTLQTSDATLQPGDWIAFEYISPITGEIIYLPVSSNTGVVHVTVTGNSEQAVTVQGKNLFDGVWNQGTINVTTGAFTSSTTRLRTGYIPTKPGEYTHSFLSDIIALRSSACYDINKAFIGIIGTNPLTVIPANGAFVVFIISKPTSTDIIVPSDAATSNFQLELGASATAYEAFVPNSPSPDYPSAINSVSGNIISHNTDSSQTQTVALPDLREGDTFVPETGQHITKMAVKTFDGTETFTEPTDAPMVTNLVTNGDFSNGTTGWTTASGSISASNNICTFLATASTNILHLIPLSPLRKYYVRALVKSNSSITRLYLGDHFYANYLVKAHTGSGNYELLSGIVTTGAQIKDSQSAVFIEDNRTSGWDNIFISAVVTIPLLPFGVGNEPTAAQMDTWLARFDNSWFDGSKSYLAFPYCYKYTLTGAKAGANSLCTHFKNAPSSHLYIIGANGDYEQIGNTIYFNASEYATITLFKAWLAARAAASDAVRVEYELDTPTTETLTAEEMQVCQPETIIGSDSVIKPSITASISSLPTLITHSVWRYRGRHTLRGTGNTSRTIQPVSQVNKMIGALQNNLVTLSPGAGQIKFPATQNSSSDANTLDDYEEGTWAPRLTFGGNSVGMTYFVQTGWYTKIGNQIHIGGFVAIDSKGSSTGNARIEGLPFSAAGGCIPTPSIWTHKVTFSGMIQAYIVWGGSVIDLGQVTEAGTDSQFTHSNFTSDSYVRFECVYSN